MSTGTITRRQLLTGAVTVAATRIAPAQAPGWSAGVSAIDITPERSLWMAGFARRTQPSQGVSLPLKAKALALQAGNGRPVVLVTLDLLGVTARLADAVAGDLGRVHGIPRQNLLLNASHTHCGPVIDQQLSVAYGLNESAWAAIREYSSQLEAKLTRVAGEAVARLRPASLAFGRGEATFGRNRRVQFSPDGPVDHTVPVLRVTGEAGEMRAVVFGYACHNTTLQDGFVEFHGDYAGVAQAELERRHRGTVALFVAGCGADANPAPRGTLELVRAHGAALADAVDKALPGVRPLAPALRAAYGTVQLPFVDTAARERWRAGLTIDPVYLARYDALMKTVVAQDGRLPRAQRAPVQVWQFGPRDTEGAYGLTLAALSGEVVVDYALRLSREYPQRQLWAAGYCNDVFGYLPSERVLREGGYEGADAMVYYGRPGPFAAGIEDAIINEVRRLAR